MPSQHENYWKQAFGDKPEEQNKNNRVDPIAAAQQRSEESRKFQQWRQEQVTAQPLPQDRPFIPEASPLEKVAPTRAPDSWIVDQSGNRIPTWLTEEDTKPKWKSKIFITQAVMFAFAVLSMVFGVDVNPEAQQLVLNAILTMMGGGSLLTIVFRLFFTKKKLI